MENNHRNVILVMLDLTYLGSTLGTFHGQTLFLGFSHRSINELHTKDSNVDIPQSIHYV